ncbi:hypothetical protein H5410_032662 [Solanum commersonii]|uniref:Uncharacterized protein n=1 Tax=Solanum commersonii TaxID=4109 RepID=A0A9J5YQA1_SOLCO|nr:hypothetical protein H5410_032662 [Solanum commersonii]
MGDPVHTVYVQEDHQEQINGTILWHTLCYDTSKLLAYRMISTCIGLILGVVQLILYFIYREKKTSTAVDEFQYA